MSPLLAASIIVMAIIGTFILRRSFRRSVAASIPHITYADETLLDLVRTRQIRAAIEYYQQHTGASSEEAEQSINYLVLHPDSLMLIVRLREGNQAPLYMDETLLNYFNQGRLNKAILYYMEKTGADPREAQIAVYALAVNPRMEFKR